VALAAVGLTRLAGQLQGRVIRAGQPEYASVCKWFIGRFTDVLPEAVVRCAAVPDVVASLAFARAAGVPIAVRSGAHSFAEYSTTPGLLIDLGPMSSVAVDAAAGRATVGPGAFIGPMAAELAKSQLVVPVGWSPMVAVAGATLGGGFGPLGRFYGLACDHLEAAEVVLADGQVVSADDTSYADLMWALRGAGGGNFGVVTSLVFRARDTVPAVDFAAWWRPPDAAAVIDRWQHWAPAAPDEINAELVLRSAPDPAQPPQLVLFGLAVNGNLADTRAMLAGFADRAGCAPTHVTVTAVGAGELPARHSYAGEQVGHAPLGGRPPEVGPGVRFLRSDFFPGALPAATIAELVDWFIGDRVPGQLRELEFIPWSGAYARCGAADTAFVHRDASFMLEHTVQSFEPELKRVSHHWVTGSRAIVHRWGNGHVYQNYPDPDLTDWAWAYYGANLARLRQVKAAYDPDDLFSFEQSIPPAGRR
jgi:FAD/FMN-containing dehydrogenase